MGIRNRQSVGRRNERDCSSTSLPHISQGRVRTGLFYSQLEQTDEYEQYMQRDRIYLPPPPPLSLIRPLSKDKRISLFSTDGTFFVPCSALVFSISSLELFAIKPGRREREGANESFPSPYTHTHLNEMMRRAPAARPTPHMHATRENPSVRPSAPSLQMRAKAGAMCETRRAYQMK